MDEFLADLRELDETQECVEAVSDGMLRVQRLGDTSKAQEMIESWIQALRASGFQSERVAFLYVANHVLQKTLFGELEGRQTPVLVELLSQHLEEAVALVCNSPMDRQNVTRLLELWHEKKIFTDTKVLKMWRCTGEDLPEFLINVDRDIEIKQGENMDTDTNKERATEQSGRRNRAPSRTAADLVADRATVSSQIKQRAEDCLRLVKVRNKLIHEMADLKTQLSEAIANMIDYEEEAATKIEQKLEQCDEIDLGLMDLTDHQKKFPEEWSQARFVSMERRKQREKVQRQKDEEIARLHHEAIAESAMHAMNLEADINFNSTSELQSLMNSSGIRFARSWCLLRSLNVDWEDWRDH
ncbi:unnamed protein product [Peronospora destructor]|uniref:CID domain-containing protein n=1 Tax=Peronospora destructor TaxID=86335 RepID=A0AAV0ULK1_9STRA|nr:unnamed protein product [Peronospora destructor]